MLVCGFLLGAAGQVVKLCADSAMQIDVDDALRGHVFTVQDSLFWVSFIAAITVCAAVIPARRARARVRIVRLGVYLVGLLVHRLSVAGAAGSSRLTEVLRMAGARSDRRRPARRERRPRRAGGADLPAERWATPTPAPGWTIAHQIAHLLWTDRVSLLSVTDETGSPTC